MVGATEEDTAVWLPLPGELLAAIVMELIAPWLLAGVNTAV